MKFTNRKLTLPEVCRKYVTSGTDNLFFRPDPTSCKKFVPSGIKVPFVSRKWSRTGNPSLPVWESGLSPGCDVAPEVPQIRLKKNEIPGPEVTWITKEFVRTRLSRADLLRSALYIVRFTEISRTVRDECGGKTNKQATLQNTCTSLLCPEEEEVCQWRNSKDETDKFVAL